MNKKVNNSIEKQRISFNKFFKKLLLSKLTSSELTEAMSYGALNGGKRIRPYLISVFSKIVNLPKNNYYRLSAAVECIHSYSLIHDDLPSMDNDDFRRGKPSVHKKFNEAQAILAGDSLHDFAFEVLSDKKTHIDSQIRIQLVNLLSSALGFKGLAGGQSLDLIFENKKTNISDILKIYNMKTGALFRFCCMSPFTMTNQNKRKINFAKNYGEIFGLIFQIIDDYLDLTGTYNNLGKTPGKDKKQGKSTMLKHIDQNMIQQYCEDKANQFIKENKYFFSQWQFLEELLLDNVKRNS